MRMLDLHLPQSPTTPGLVSMSLSSRTALRSVACLGTRPAAYTFQVTGTANGTSEVESQAVTLNVTI